MLHCDAADRQDEFGFLLREAVGRLVGGDAIFVEARGFLSRLENRHVMAGDRQRMRAGKAGRAGADDGDPLPGRRSPRVGVLARLHHCVGGVSLQKADSHRLALRRLAHAGFLAERFGRADPRAHAAHDVFVENRARGAERIVGGDLADEQGNVDRGWAGLLAGRIIAEVAAFRLDHRLVPGQRRMQVGEIRRQGRGIEKACGDSRRGCGPIGNRHSSPPRVALQRRWLRS